jgi:hypothetical protein
MCLILFHKYVSNVRACGSVVGWGTVLQAGRTRVNGFFDWPIPYRCIMALGLIQLTASWKISQKRLLIFVHSNLSSMAVKVFWTVSLRSRAILHLMGEAHFRTGWRSVLSTHCLPQFSLMASETVNWCRLGEKLKYTLLPTRKPRVFNIFPCNPLFTTSFKP